MWRLRRMTVPQRVVIVVAIGLVLLGAWSWWYFGEIAASEGGWMSYAPLTETSTYAYVVERRRPLYLIVPIVLIVAWASVSVWLLGSRTDDVPSDH
jgi:hypothetical protein